MDNYKHSKVVGLLKQLNPKVPGLIQGVAWWMTELMPRPEQPAWGQGDTLVLGGDCFANVIGSPEFGYRPVGVCKSLQEMWQGRFGVRHLKSWSRFVWGQFPQNVNIDGPFKYVFVFPSYQWNDWKEWVMARLTEDAHVVVAQNVPFEHEGEHIYMKVKWNACSVVESAEEAKAVIFRL